jgi:hypothetical protein
MEMSSRQSVETEGDLEAPSGVDKSLGGLDPEKLNDLDYLWQNSHFKSFDPS